MKSQDAIHRSFCERYADAVLRFVTEGRHGDVVFDDFTQRFSALSVEAGVAPAACHWWVGEDWESFVGPLTCRTVATHPQFSASALLHEIVFALLKSPTGKRMSRILAGLD